MLTDLLQSIYNRIAQLGKSIQDLKGSLDSLNANIEDKITKLTTKISEFSTEIGVTQTKHIEVLKEIGDGVNLELKKMLGGLGLNEMEKLIENLENFSTLASEVLNQDTVNLLLSETISSVKVLKSEMTKEE